jgi:hypothetical protein
LKTSRLKSWPVLLSAMVLIVTLLSPADALAGLAKGYAVVRDARGVWWFESPGGARFYSLGICNVTPEPFRPKPGTRFYNPVPTEFNGKLDLWASHVRDLLIEHGFNTLGAWSHAAIPTDERLHTTPVLYVVQHEGTRCLTPLMPDFEAFVLANLKEAIAKLPPRDRMIGVFLDNEMPWYGKSGWDDIATYTLLEQAIELPREDFRHQSALKFLQARHADVAAFNAAWLLDLKSWEDLTLAELRTSNAPAATVDRHAFTEMLAERFYEVSTRLVREHLPNTLILGTRIPGNAPDAVIKACGRHCDVMSVNEYRTEPKASEHTLTRFWLLGGKPIMHTEFSWRGAENASGNPNQRGAGAVVPTQKDRAAAYTSMLTDIATVPYVIGSHWFEFADQSPEGRFDGENSNYGVVDIHNKPYVELLTAMRETNARIADIHASTERVMPTVLRESIRVQYSPGQHPGRPPMLSLLGEWTRDPEIWGASDSKIVWRRDGDGIALEYDVGESWGGGINLFPPKHSAEQAKDRFIGDLDGYSSFVVVAELPRGLQMNIVVAEASAGQGGATGGANDGSGKAGDDGEAFISRALMGTGKPETYRVPIEDLIKQPFFGNQAGAIRIDMQALRNTGLQISGAPRRGEVKIRRFALER